MSAATTQTSPPVRQLEDLLGLTTEQLYGIYSTGSAENMPSGQTRGVPIIAPGGALTKMLAKISPPLWAGKLFYKEDGLLLNRVLGMKLFKAKLLKAESWYDGKPALIIDYQDTSLVCSKIRDEIREVAPGVYLGLAYWRTSGKPVMVIHFGLTTN